MESGEKTRKTLEDSVENFNLIEFQLKLEDVSEENRVS